MQYRAQETDSVFAHYRGQFNAQIGFNLSAAISGNKNVVEQFKSDMAIGHTQHLAGGKLNQRNVQYLVAHCELGCFAGDCDNNQLCFLYEVA